MSYPHGVATGNEVIAAALAWRDSLIPNTSTANYHPAARLRDAVDRHREAHSTRARPRPRHRRGADRMIVLNPQCAAPKCQRRDTRFVHWTWRCPLHDLDTTPDPNCTHSLTSDGVCSYCCGEVAT